MAFCLSCLTLFGLIWPQGEFFQAEYEMLTRMQALPNLVKGRVLVCFVKKGMTSDQVSRIFGKTYPALIAGGIGRCDYYYPDLGVSISFSVPVVVGERTMSVADAQWSLPWYDGDNLSAINKEWEKIWEQSPGPREFGGIK
jgi:hypothetical protein